MGFYRKKPIVIEAHQFQGSYADAEFLNRWSGGKVTGLFNEDQHPYLNVETLEGVVRAELNDWIIKGIAGEFYPAKPQIFGFTYIPVETTEVPKVDVVHQGQDTDVWMLFDENGNALCAYPGTATLLIEAGEDGSL
jgi:hypothetical protein